MSRRLRFARQAAVTAMALSFTQCLLVEDPGGSEPRYEFASPLRDTVMNIGDTTDVLPCDLRVDGRALPCALGIRYVEGDVTSVVPGPRLNAARPWKESGHAYESLGIGRALLELRPLNVQLPADTIARYAEVRTVVPRIGLVHCPTGQDTLTSLGQVRIYIPHAMTRDGRPIPFAPMTWLQDSGYGVAAFVPGELGVVRSIAEGVAVFRAVTDTATASCRIVVRVSP